MSAGGEISRILALYELSRARALPAGLEIYARGMANDGDEAGLDLMADEARRAAEAFSDLAAFADQQGIAVAERRASFEARGRGD